MPFTTAITSASRNPRRSKGKGQLISECLFGILNLPTKKSTNFCPLTPILLLKELSKKKRRSGQINKVKALSYKIMNKWAI